jgi:hypothetical protein
MRELCGKIKRPEKVLVLLTCLLLQQGMPEAGLESRRTQVFVF